MKKKVKLALKILLICAGGYLFSIAQLGSGYIPSEKQILADKIRSRVGKKIASEKHLRLIGMGGQLSQEVKMLGLSFQGFQELTLLEARSLIVFSIKTFLDEINSDENLRPYLKAYPFTAKNIEIGIWLYKPDHSEVSSTSIRYVVNRDALINYYPGATKFDPDNPILIETAQEAFEKIQNVEKKPKVSLNL